MFVTLLQYLVWLMIFIVSFGLPKEGLGVVGSLTMLYAFLEFSKLGKNKDFKESNYLKDVLSSFFFPVFLFLASPTFFFPALCLSALALIKTGSMAAQLLLNEKQRDKKVVMKRERI